MFFWWVLVVPAVLQACKRISPPYSKNAIAEPPMKRAKRVAFCENTSTEAFIPEDIFVTIFTFIFNQIRVKKTNIHPAKAFNLVSKQWYNRVHSASFQALLRTHPRTSLLILKHGYLSGEDFEGRNANLVKAASALINIPTAFKLLFNARSPLALASLAALPVFKTGMSKATYKIWLRYAVRHSHFTGNIVPIGVRSIPCERRRFARTPRSVIARHLNSVENYTLEGLSVSELTMLLIMEDVFKPDYFTKIFNFTTKQISLAYKTNMIKSKVQFLLDSLRNLKLPGSKTNGLFITLLHPLFLAAYIGEIKFIDFIQLNYTCIRQGYLNSDQSELLDVVEAISNRQITQLPVECIPAAKRSILRMSTFKFLGFSKKKIKARSQLILANSNISDQIRSIVTKYL